MSLVCKINEVDKHSYDVNSVIVHKGSVYSGADDGKIIRWDENLKKLGEAQAHPCSVYCLAALDDTIYSCCNDGTIKSWTLDLQPKSTIATETCEFWKIVVSDGKLYAGDDQGMLRVFVKDQPAGMYELMEPVKDMKVEDNTIFVTKDTDVVIFTLTVGSNKNTYSNRTIFPGRAPLSLVGNKIVFCDTTAKGITVNDNDNDSNYKEVAQLQDAHDMVIMSIAGFQKGSDTFIYTGGWDKVLKEWKLADNKLQKGREVNVDIVLNSLCATDKGIIYAAGGDGMVIKIQT